MPGRPPQRSRRRTALLGLTCVALAYAVMMQPLGWNQTAHFALVKSLAHGTPRIDRYQWETGDKSYTGGHFFTAKAPGLALLSLPWFEALKALGGPEAAADLVDRRAPSSWSAEARHAVRFHTRGRSPREQARVVGDVNRETPLVWAVALATVLTPAVALLFLVRACAQRLAPGFGTAAAVTLGLGTIVLPFSTLFFAHVLSATLAFGSFALLWRERDRAPRLALVAGAGALAGLAIVVEYPLVLAAVVLGVYAASRKPYVRRAMAFGAGGCVGVAPLIAYNLWAFGSVGSLSYRNVVAFAGASGHDRLGLNSTGVFGVGWPRLESGLQLLFAGRGLLVLTPVVVMGVVGIVLLYRRRRAEALTIAAIAVVFLLYNAGYYLPFGGNSPGPRFLVALLPFLAVPLGLAFERFTAITAGLALASTATMVIATVANPQLGTDHTGYWLGRLAGDHLEPTVMTALVGATGWLAAIPFLVAVAGALVLTTLASPGLGSVRAQLPVGALALVSWAAAASVLPHVVGSAVPSREGAGSPVLILAGAVLALLGLAALATRRAPASIGTAASAATGPASRAGRHS